jgi:cytochrome c oxidase subunit IV
MDKVALGQVSLQVIYFSCQSSFHWHSILIHLSSTAGTIGPVMTTKALLIINEQDRQHMYNVTMRHVCVTMVAVEKQ